METLIFAIVQNIVVPELARFIERKFNQTGRIPTKEELMLEAVRLRDEIVAEGTTFEARLLAENPGINLGDAPTSPTEPVSTTPPATTTPPVTPTSPLALNGQTP